MRFLRRWFIPRAEAQQTFLELRSISQSFIEEQAKENDRLHAEVQAMRRTIDELMIVIGKGK
mgnify:FL=1